LEKTVKEISTVKMPPPALQDDSTVRIGMMSAAFPPAHAARADVADDRKVRMGMMSPAFPPKRAQ
jgi:hypothetical protein